MTARRWWKLLSMYAQDLLLMLVQPPHRWTYMRSLIRTLLPMRMPVPDADAVPPSSAPLSSLP